MHQRANNDLGEQNDGIGWPITYEGRNQPDVEDEQRAVRESKRPDFQWGFTDRTEGDPSRQDKFYVVECKRLGKPVRKDWVFNRNYVQHGILRFVSREHGYAMSAPSGAMVGYMQSMAPDDILEEVNNYAAQVSLPPIVLQTGAWIEHGVSRLDESLDGRSVPPTSFQLRHLWADFREG